MSAPAVARTAAFFDKVYGDCRNGAVEKNLTTVEWLPTKAKQKLGWVPEKPVRTLHVIVMLYFVGFTIAHVGLVLATGAVRNLNHMYAGRDDESWIGLVVFAGSLVVMIVGWVVARPAVLTRLAALGGTVRK